jgi:hypothetical protein
MVVSTLLTDLSKSTITALPNLLCKTTLENHGIIAVS